MKNLYARLVLFAIKPALELRDARKRAAEAARQESKLADLRMALETVRAAARSVGAALANWPPKRVAQAGDEITAADLSSERVPPVSDEGPERTVGDTLKQEDSTSTWCCRRPPARNARSKAQEEFRGRFGLRGAPNGAEQP